VEIAVEKLRGFCGDVSIVGNREDLRGIAEVVGEERVGVGPGAGIEAGLKAARQEWVMFVPVDVPLVPQELLRSWGEAVIEKGEVGCGVSYLLVNGQREAAFCMVRRAGLGSVSAALERGERRLDGVLASVDEDDKVWLWACDAARFGVGGGATEVETEYWFSNVNTPEELVEAEAWAKHRIGR
jgi:molybdenum cofactor guanylyltransferase